MQNEITDFIDYISSEKGLALNTLESYRRDLESFADFLKRRGQLSFVSANSDQIVAFMGALQNQGYASASICRSLIAIKVFYRFLLREGIVGTNIALYLESPKLWQLIPEVLTCEEVEQLLKQPDPLTFQGARDKAILEVLYASGIRVSELCSLDIYSIDDETLRVMGKGGKERMVPIGQEAVVAIDHYFAFRDAYDSDKQQALFVNKRGHRIDRMSVWRMIKNYVKMAGINKNISPHTLRHSFATHLLDNGADLRIIQEMLGHASISSTERYTHISSFKLQNAFEAFHPRMDASDLASYM